MPNPALTEGVYYILLSLLEPLHGYGIIQNVEGLSGGRVRLAAGTLYGAINTLLEKGWIAALEGEADSRKKEYVITDLGREMLAKELYLNKYYISHVFHERMQMGFKEFVNKLRIEHSCGLLEKGCSIIDIAYASGFSSVRTYNRAFLKYMEMSPREYMKGKNVSRQLNK